VHLVGFTTETLQIVSDIQILVSYLRIFSSKYIHMHGPVLIMTKQGTNKRNIQAPLHNQTCRGKTTNVTDSKFVSVALVIHHAKRICPIILSPATSLAVPCFCTVSHKLHGFRGKKKI